MYVFMCIYIYIYIYIYILIFMLNAYIYILFITGFPLLEVPPLSENLLVLPPPGNISPSRLLPRNFRSHSPTKGSSSPH